MGQINWLDTLKSLTDKNMIKKISMETSAASDLTGFSRGRLGNLLGLIGSAISKSVIKTGTASDLTGFSRGRLGNLLGPIGSAISKSAIKTGTASDLTGFSLARLGNLLGLTTGGLRTIALASILLLAMATTATAQLYPVFSQYYFNELVINPAYAGSHVQFSATAAYRNQWINFPGAPQTISFSTHTSFVKGKVGVGLMFNEDKIGSYANRDIAGSYSYKIKFRDATLSFGLQGMLYFIGADFSALNLKDPTEPAFQILNQLKPNVGGGIYYHKKNFFVGFSVPMIINSKFDNINVSEAMRQTRNYFLRAGLIKPFGAKGNVKFNPSFLVRSQEGQPLSVDLNAGFIIYDVFNAGVSWRTALGKVASGSGDALISFVSLKLSEQLHFNYSFDWTTSHLRPFSSGTHEFMLNYRFKISGVHKNLACPTYWHYRE
jgi:type IX secretion system PorP/SprF family membrane protein